MTGNLVQIISILAAALAVSFGAIGPALAAGNTVVLKPASNTPMLGWAFMRLVAEAGIPPGVINFLPGSGSVVGDALVDHPRTRFVNFTGSKEIGLCIAERSSVVHDGQRWMKRSRLGRRWGFCRRSRPYCE